MEAEGVTPVDTVEQLYKECNVVSLAYPGYCQKLRSLSTMTWLT